MTTHVYNKLVRDRIPQIIEEKGKTCSIKILDDAAYHRELRKKLQEEWQEYLAASHDEERLEELADMLEVIYALANEHGASHGMLEELRHRKAEMNGAFAEKLLLLEVVERGKQPNE
ncbi:phosphoribosyl-ATP pyrophosphohydrolase [Brevibacillus fluminis]|uniref:Phosphoribosyl-ATP pyrophosphohydrolase n=1 Tax=Brevibacillus fluminis TaxID=511487 RepID=A0A3M8DRC8_9BACL|nr:nucleoside triphosphate pyrophosphohydrolase [Brevibacillus fluminis]RNB90706.1 phosphoribosyl-ATP pyrophosphohydrolase [Brevibacillus fluminis]